MNELALFAGVGGGLLATKWLLGWCTVCYVEWEQYCIDVLQARIADGLLDDAPIWDDARTFDGRPWAGCVDIVTAGFPCQPFSVAGRQQADADERNMWPDTIRIIREVQPAWVLLENVPGLLAGSHGYYGQVLSELAQSGYDARWRVLSAAEVGAPFVRDRLFVVAFSNKSDGKAWLGNLQNGQAPVQRRVGKQNSRDVWLQVINRNAGSDNGVAHYLERGSAIGNGQVPLVVATVWELLTEGRHG